MKRNLVRQMVIWCNSFSHSTNKAVALPLILYRMSKMVNLVIVVNLLVTVSSVRPLRKTDANNSHPRVKFVSAEIYFGL